MHVCLLCITLLGSYLCILSLCELWAGIYTCSTDHIHLIVLEDNQQKQLKQYTDSFRRQSMDISKQYTSILQEHWKLVKCCFLFQANFPTMATPKKLINQMECKLFKCSFGIKKKQKWPFLQEISHVFTYLDNELLLIAQKKPTLQSDL